MGSTGQSITLANSIIGVGILAMPFCYQQCGIVLATLILLFMGLVSRLCCYFLLKAALIARRRNFEFLAFHVFGSAGKLAVEVGIIGFLMGTCIAYFVVVGDLGPQIIAKMFNINQSDILRTSIMVIVSLVCILPLGLLRNVDSLSNVSAATIGFYFCLVMKVTAEAASQIYLGEWQDRVAMWRPAGVLQCWPIFSMALFCQTQLFEIFESLPSLSLEKMNVVTKNAINICTSVYFTLGLFGYIAFSSQTISGNILMSLSPTMASDVIKLGFVMSVAFSFPLIIFPCRASLYSFLYKKVNCEQSESSLSSDLATPPDQSDCRKYSIIKVHASHHDHIINHSIPESTFRCITVAIIAVALFISLLIPNIELVLGLVGSTIGVLICVVFPAACFVKVTFKDTNERVLAKFTIVLGLIILVLGTFANLQAAEQQVDKYDDRYITQEKIDKIVEDFFEAKRMQKTDDVIVKPLLANEDKSKRKNNEERNKVIPDTEVKDSEVQPPNPVPPESQSNEKPLNPAPKKLKEETKKTHKDAIEANKLELHPRNLNPKGSIEVKEVTEKSEQQKVDAEKAKIEDKVQEKIDMMKQQLLIETIKQHGEEQKELLEEQKEILHEIKKTKQELQQSKEKEINNEEAKKIAVESIQKIANMAIQSLSGATDKPVESPEKIANEAVQEIAKKAVESIVAIEDKLKVEKPAQINNIPNQNNNNQENVINLPAASVDIPKQEIKNVLEHISQNIPLNDIPIQSKIEPRIQDNIVQGNVIQNNADAPKIHVNNGQGSVQNHDIPSEKKQEIPVQKTHSHSPDEPQSYKRGEDIQQQKNDDSKPISKGIDQNVPLVVAMNANSQNAAKLNDNENVKVLEPLPNNGVINKVPNDALNINNIPEQNVQNQAQIRQKREIVDCVDKNSLNPQEKITEIINPAKLEANTEAILSKVDLNDALAKRIPIDSNAIHIGRSLKSIDESER